MNNFFIKQVCLPWWLVRMLPLLMLPGLFFDLEILALWIPGFLFHVKHGVESVINDYIHDFLTVCISLIMIRLLSIQIFVYFVEFLF